ncbi:CAF17-like 4Fe-4S cluster assembly/insertion protein YgfZ [Rhizorhapis sp. SPR117]|uniref:CAF17-like 4Fe-4S cluster assembly/insertion protein YgfZ n=1 Tax=Rhizorhapis sp. SPR117 TaxID=2912611 RepID=UPI001F1A3F92|nr:folate-binding protein [Rhizorhapis sp. SPR117]
MSETTLIDRAVIHISGEETRPFLQGLVTQDVLTLVEGEARWAGLLTAQGKALFDFFIWAHAGDILIDCEAAQADALVRRLSLYRLRRKVEVARDDMLAVHWSRDAEGRPADPRLPELGQRWIAPADGADAHHAAAYRAHRLSLGVTEGVAELGSDQTLWLEANARELHGVDFGKGCYVGQENTARMHYRSKVNRRLVVVPLKMADAKRQRLALPELGLSIELRRIEDMDGLDLPLWLASAIAAAPTES